MLSKIPNKGRFFKQENALWNRSRQEPKLLDGTLLKFRAPGQTQEFHPLNFNKQERIIYMKYA